MPADPPTAIVSGPVDLPLAGLAFREFHIETIALTLDFAQSLDAPWVLRVARTIEVTLRTPDPGADRTRSDVARAILCVGRVVAAARVDAGGRLDLRFDDGASITTGPGDDWTLSNGRESWMRHPTGGVAVWRVPELAAIELGSPEGTLLDRDAELPLAGLTITDSRLGRSPGFSTFAGTVPTWQVEFSGDVEYQRDHVRVTVARETPSDGASLALGSAIGRRMLRVLAATDGSLRIELDDGSVWHAPGGSWSVSADLGWSWEGLEAGGIRYRELTERPMDEAAADRLAAAYLDYQGSDRKDLWWSWERIQELVQGAPDAAWTVLHAAILRAPDPTVVSYLGAGALEDLLERWGPRVIDRIEDAGRTEPRVVYALSHVWRSGMDEDVWRRVQLLVGRQ